MAAAFDHDPRGLLQVGRGTLRQEHLERIALARVRTLERAGRHVDDVEVVLAHLVRLRDDLQLPFTIRAGSYTGERTSDVTDADLRNAMHQVLAQERDFDASLDAWPPWQRVLARRDPDGFAAAEEKLVDWVGDGTYERRLDAYLRRTMPGWAADDDARREAGLVVMVDLQHDAYGSLTRALLAEHGLASAADAFRDPATRP